MDVSSNMDRELTQGQVGAEQGSQTQKERDTLRDLFQKISKLGIVCLDC